MFAIVTSLRSNPSFIGFESASPVLTNGALVFAQATVLISLDQSRLKNKNTIIIIILRSN